MEVIKAMFKTTNQLLESSMTCHAIVPSPTSLPLRRCHFPTGSVGEN
jgi:hypothetical protein